MRFIFYFQGLMLKSCLRVNHAGEIAASQIYKGQLFVLGNTNVKPILEEMYEQEKQHLKMCEKHLVAYKVRPSLLLPLWHVAGFAMGVGSAFLGKNGAMACTEAVETVVGQHYNE